jgi:hypothetical protein
MALKTGTEKTDVSAPTSTPAEAPATPPAAVQTTVLELALYKIYTWGGVSYEKGKPYRFTNSDAMILLAEQDLGRPVWKLYQKPVQRVAQENKVVDATTVRAPVPVDDIGDVSSIPGEKRINVGDDSEIADILDRGGDVTV